MIRRSPHQLTPDEQEAWTVWFHRGWEGWRGLMPRDLFIARVERAKAKARAGQRTPDTAV